MIKRGELQVLVATDIAARGIDIDQLPHVVNYDLPNVPEDYVHRIGRTGRAGANGEAISLVCVDEHQFLKDIERLIKREIPSQVIAGFEPDPNAKAEPIQLRSQGHGARSGGRNAGNGARGGAGQQKRRTAQAKAGGVAKGAGQGQPHSQSKGKPQGKTQGKTRDQAQDQNVRRATTTTQAVQPKTSRAPQPRSGKAFPAPTPVLLRSGNRGR